MNRRVVVAALVVVSVSAGLAAGWLLSRPPPLAEPTLLSLPRPLPGFRLPDVAGASHDIADWRGHFLLINFWATWCAPCRREMPLLQALQEQARGDGVVVVGVAVDRQAPVETFLVESGVTYPILIGQQEAMQIAESLVPAFVGLPLSVLVSPAGQILHLHLGELHPEDIRMIAAVAAELGANRLSDQQAARRLETALKRG